MFNVAVLGWGNIGSGVIELLSSPKVAEAAGDEINLKYILEKRDCTGRPLADRVVTEIDPIAADPTVNVAAEMLGGLSPAYEYSRAALEHGISVVTSNKVVVAAKGDELTAIANAHGARYLYEASVGGGIPIIHSIADSLCGEDIDEIDGILNGTTNYILTKMSRDWVSLDYALDAAKKNGYAERDPSADVSGMDACRKIVILAAMAFGTIISPEDVDCRGIDGITEADIDRASRDGCAVKLIARAVRLGDGFHVSVSPMAVLKSNPLFYVDEVYNGILVSGAFGDLLFRGMGAGRRPTASAVVSDIIDIARRPRMTAKVWNRDSARFIRRLGDEELRREALTLGTRI